MCDSCFSIEGQLIRVGVWRMLSAWPGDSTMEENKNGVVNISYAET